QIMDEVEAYHQLKQEPLITPPPPSITLEDDTSLFTRRTKPAIDHSPSFESSTNNIYRDLVLSLSVNASAETSNSDQSKNKCDSWTSSKKNTHVVKGKDIQSGTSMRSRSRSLSRFRRKRSSPSAYREYNSNICRTQTTRRYSPPKKRSKSKKRSRDRSHPYRKSGTPSKAQGSLSRTRRMSSSLSADREYFLSSQTKTNRPNHKRQRSRSKDSDRTRRRDSSVEITYKTKAPRLDHNRERSKSKELIFYHSPRKAILPLERTLRSKSKERGQNRRRHSHLSRRSKSKDRSRVRKRLSPPYRKSRKPSPIRQKRNFSPSPRRSVYKSRRYSPARLPKRRSRSPRRPRWIPHIERSRSPSRLKRHPHFKRLRSPSRPKRSPHFCRSRSPSRPNLSSPIRPMPISAMVPLHNYQIGHSISVGSHVPPAPLMMCTPTRFTHFEYCEHRMHADCEPLPLNPASFAFNHCVTMTRSPVYLGPEDLRHRIQSTYRPNFNAPPFAPNAYPNWTVDFPRNYY
ncbi:hypothetical protein KR009_006736, partial [Drosophila setifemur]